MNEQNTPTLDTLFGNGTLDIGSGESVFDPFVIPDTDPAETAAINPQEPPKVSTPNTTPFPAAESIAYDDAKTTDGEYEPEADDDSTDDDAEPNQPEINVPAKPSNVTAPDFNPLAAAINQAEEQTVKSGAAGVLAKPPIFFYGSAKEDITDKTQTFEQLRISKSDDFPELEDGKRVTWTMEYGAITKQVPKPKETVIYKLKEEIEASKEFLEMLKKQKDKKDAIVCKVKPRITAQSKGVVSTYKGVFTNLAEAEQSDKAIMLLPSRDGKVYEIRFTEAGKFIVPVTNAPELSEVSAGFFPALPPIPFPLFCQVIGFFRHFMGRGQETEAMVQIFWDKELLEYRIVVPHQQVGKAHIEAQLDPEDALDEERYFCFADIHSHNSMKAFFSPIDDRDEKATRVYMVIGRLDHYFPEIKTRISCGGHFLPIAPNSVIGELPHDFPGDWLQNVETECQEKGQRYFHDYYVEGATL